MLFGVVGYSSWLLFIYLFVAVFYVYCCLFVVYVPFVCCCCCCLPAVVVVIYFTFTHFVSSRLFPPFVVYVVDLRSQFVPICVDYYWLVVGYPLLQVVVTFWLFVYRCYVGLHLLLLFALPVMVIVYCCGCIPVFPFIC